MSERCDRVSPWLGVVADDLTGACDLADAVCEAGASSVVQVGTPGGPLPLCDCAVVALKSRTALRVDAVAESLAAARVLLDAGCTTLYQKYCSTFDSTDEGNIGPVADALARLVGGNSAGTPATPRVGRTVYRGHLFLGRQLLSESPLRDHPLTPMRDPDLVRVLARQSSHTVTSIDWDTVRAGPDAVAAAVSAVTGHVILDALTDEDLDTVATALLRLDRLVVGGAAGLAASLARVHPGRSGGAAARSVPAVPDGRQLILSGSCSTRTREQVADFAGPVVPLSPVDLDADFAGTVDAVLAAIAAADSDPVLISSSADPSRVAWFESRLGLGRPAELLEAATAEIAARAVGALGVSHLLVAGGETSGAVVRALGVGTLRVGPAAGPGLPWMVPAEMPVERGPRLALLFKSGNFGDPDLFTTAWNHRP